MPKIAEEAVSGNSIFVSKESVRVPLVSVCIANYNGASIISGCIESVLAQDFGFPVEILVHDDASKDGSAEIVEREYPSVHLIRSETNVGFCIANNRMVSAAQGEFILLLNNDAELLPGALNALFEEQKSLSAPAILSLPQFNYFSGELIDRGCLLDPFFNPVPNTDPGRREVAMVIGACLWIQKQLWDKLGGFPEWFGSIGEDLYLCCRARLAGHPVCALGVAGYRHRVGQSFGGGKVADGRLRTTFRRRALSERNKTFVMLIAYPSPFMQLMLALHLLLLLVEGVALSLVKFDGRYLREIYLPVFGALVRQRGEWRAARSVAQQGRRVARANFYAVFDWLPYKVRMVIRHGVPILR